MQMREIVLQYQRQFEARYKGSITQQQRQAMNAVLDCHTERYGSMSLECSACDLKTVRHHACGHRACPTCQNHDTSQWLHRQQQKLLPVDYFMVTFTLPSELRPLAWHHQKQIYNALMQCARQTLAQFALNSQQLGGDTGMTMVLHSHSRRLDYHPHVHVIVPGVCINRRRNQCTKLRGKYLFNEKNLAKVFRARFLEKLSKSGMTTPTVPAEWIAHCTHVGKGLPALQYLSRYLYRGVISEKNLVADDGDQVTFGYVDSQTGVYKTRTVKGEVFLWLTFQHVLPKGFRRVRDYGFLNGNGRKTLQRIQIALKAWVEQLPPVPRPAHVCTACGGLLNITAFIRPAWRSG